MWNLADGRLLELSLAKQDAMRWWPHVLQGEPQINIQKVRRVQAAGMGDIHAAVCIADSSAAASSRASRMQISGILSKHLLTVGLLI